MKESLAKNRYKKFINSFEVENLEIPISFVKFYFNNDEIPKEIQNYHTKNVTFTSCQAARQSALGDPLLLTIENIGCIAAAITFGLVDANQNEPLKGSRVYTDIMKNNFEKEEDFTPPSPKEFNDGTVYACKAVGKKEYALFGDEDSGRFVSKEIAVKAINEMMALQPPKTKGVFFFTKDFCDIEIIPDVVIMSVRPVELTRIAQAYQFLTGERVEANFGPLRAVNSDLIVRPYLTQKINITPYCLGARIIGQFEPDRMGIGMPYKIFEIIVDGMEKSKGGYPFKLYPGAKIQN